MSTIAQIGTDVAHAAALLQSGEVIGIPTETVYGLAANALNEEAVLKIFEAKGRPKFDPLIVHCASIEAVKNYVTGVPALAQQLLEKFAPGPVTVLLPKKKIIPDLVTSGLPQVAVRIPQHPLTLALLQALPFPLAAPSANPFGYISPTTAQHVAQQLGSRIPYILDGGPAGVGVESTIIGFEEGKPVLYRLGGLSISEIEQITGPLQQQLNQSSNPVAPGTLKSHYAPRKKLYFNPKGIVSGNAAVIGFNQLLPGYPAAAQTLLSPTGNLHEAARNLFATMRALDEDPCDFIIAVAFPGEGLGLAINDRLRRAAAG